MGSTPSAETASSLAGGRESERLPENDIEVTIFRALCKNGISIRITPLVVPILGHLQDDLENIVRQRVNSSHRFSHRDTAVCTRIGY